MKYLFFWVLLVFLQMAAVAQTSDKKINLQDFIGKTTNVKDNTQLEPKNEVNNQIYIKKESQLTSTDTRMKTVILAEEQLHKNWDYQELLSKLRVDFGFATCGKTTIFENDQCHKGYLGCRIEIRSERCQLVRVRDGCPTAEHGSVFVKRLPRNDPQLIPFHLCQKAYISPKSTQTTHAAK